MSTLWNFLEATLGFDNALAFCYIGIGVGLWLVMAAFVVIFKKIILEDFGK